VRAVAQEQLLTESAWLKRLVTAALRDASAGESVTHAACPDKPRNPVLQAAEEASPSSRVYVRLRADDRLLLRERAFARGLRSGTYVSVLVRAHLRNLTPLPKEELVALKRSVAELGAIGRNLNQIARGLNTGSRIAGPTREDVRAILKVCEAMRDSVKGLMRANLTSWEIGHAEAER